MPPRTRTSNVAQPVTDDSIQVRHLSHYQFSWIAQDPGQAGVFTLQLVLDQGAWEEVLTVSAEDAEVLRGLLRHGSDVAYDVRRRVLMFGTTPSGTSNTPQPPGPHPRWPNKHRAATPGSRTLHQ
jgi:hypothetical protein